MSKAFKKGQRVTVIWDWDRKGKAYVRHATVHSCGTKVLRLTCDVTGDEFGHGLTPVVAEAGREGVRPLLEGDALDAEAMAVAVRVRDYWLTHYADCIARNSTSHTPHSNYIRHMQQQIDEMGQPQWAMYADLCRSVADRVRAER